MEFVAFDQKYLASLIVQYFTQLAHRLKRKIVFLGGCLEYLTIFVPIEQTTPSHKEISFVNVYGGKKVLIWVGTCFALTQTLVVEYLPYTFTQ